MKKIVLLFASCMLACTFTACGSSSGSASDSELAVSAEEYEKNSTQTYWNTAASSVQKSISSAIYDLDAKGMDVCVDKNKPAVFSSIRNINTANETELVKYALNYFDKLDEIDYVAVVENGSVTFAAAAQGPDATIVGVNPTTSPNSMTIRQIVESYS